MHNPLHATDDGFYTSRDLGKYLEIAHTSIERWWRSCRIPPPKYLGTLVRPYYSGGHARERVHVWDQEQADYIATLMLPPGPPGATGAPRIGHDYKNRTDLPAEYRPLPIPLPVRKEEDAA